MMKKRTIFFLSLVLSTAAVRGVYAQEKIDPESFKSLAARCAPTIAVDTLTALVKTESSFNPYAIGVVGGKGKHPKNLQQAVFYISELVAKKRNFSVGLGQINQANFKSLGVTAEQLFDPCTNLKAAERILSKCYVRMSKKRQGEAQALADALSCYYSGNDVTGYKHGYVKRVTQNSQQSTTAIKVPSISLLSPQISTSAKSAQPTDAVASAPTSAPLNLLVTPTPQAQGGKQDQKLIF